MNFKKFFHPLAFVLILLLVYFLLPFLPINRVVFGIIPREPLGLIGIFTSPLIHANIYHLLSNSVSLLILGGIMFAFYRNSATYVMIFCYFIPNIIVWFIGRPAPHVGASGIIYGIAFFLFLIGFLRKDFTSTILSVLIIIFYGGMFFGLLPVTEEMSWEGHLGGAVTGIACAIFFRKPAKRRKLL
ncbi:MAG: rhomboid family intramembrane serine protease [Cytophagaceae bacterium]